MSNKKPAMHVTVAVCTRERPIMLRQLLETVTRLRPVSGVNVHVVVVENGPELYGSEVVAEFSDRLSISYFNEPQTGLVHARNTSVEKNLASGAEWIGFVDDDERMDKNWLCAMFDATNAYPDSRAFAGPVDKINAESATEWFPRFERFVNPTGRNIWNVGAGNLFFNRNIFTSDGLELRFDEEFNLSGSEDTDLCLRMHMAGIQIIWVQEASCEEDVVAERATLSARTSLAIRQKHNFGRIHVKRYGSVLGRILILFYIVKLSFHALSYFMFGVLVLIASENGGKKMLGTAIYKACGVIGYAKSLILPVTKGYAVVEGH